MMRRNCGDYEYFQDLVEDIFAAPSKNKSMAIIEKYKKYWSQIIGTRGFTGKRVENSNTYFNKLMYFEDNSSGDEQTFEGMSDEPIGV